MSLALARCLDDPQALWRELEGHWRRGYLVGLAPPQEQPLLTAAVLGEAAAADGGAPPAGSGCAERPIVRRSPRPPTGPPEALASAESDPLALAANHGRAQPAPGRRERKPASPWWEAEGTNPAEALQTGSAAPWGAALVLGSGGSSGGRRWCLQPLAHLQASAQACGAWLMALGLDPGRCLHLDALPLHHVSGLMPLIRTRQWGAELRWLPPELLRTPGRLPQACPLPSDRPVLLSLVPTQLHRLLDSSEALAWLRGCALIWVGGAALGADLAARARSAGLRLSPCYGATETAAMVCALPPERFLAGEQGCGPPLDDVELQLEGGPGAIALRCARLSPGWFEAGRLHRFGDADGWWRSGDAGLWQPAPISAGGPSATPRKAADESVRGRRATAGDDQPTGASLVILGRLDGAIHSGGETVFPDQVRLRLLELIRDADLPVAELLLLPQADPLWGERLVALVRWRAPEDRGAGAPKTPATNSTTAEAWLNRLTELARDLPPPQRPRRWLTCPELETSVTGKWEQQRWKNWLARRDAGQA